MSLARTSPSLRTRILENESRMATVQSGWSGITKPSQQSFVERYRGTEYDTHYTLEPVAKPGSAYTRGRAFVLVTGAAVTSVLLLALASTPA